MASKIAEYEIPSDLNSMPPLAAFASVWGLIKIVLTLVKVFTGSRADAKIDSVIEWGDGVVSTQGLLGENENPSQGGATTV